MGTWYETRARVALAMRDEPGFRHWAERCADVYTRGGHAALTAKYGRLLHAAHSEGLGGRALDDLAGRADDEERDADDALQATIWSRLGECVDGHERARCALLVLMEHCRVSEGHLYGLIEGRLSHLVSIPADAAGPDLAPVLEQCVQAELRANETTAIRGASIHPPPSARTAATPLHRCVVLAVEREGDTVIAAAAALGPAGGAAYEPPPSHLLATLAEGLLEHDDVDPMTRLV
jgi:hypothetical protein